MDPVACDNLSDNQANAEIKIEKESNAECLALKNAGNEAFRGSNFKEAIELFTSAIDLDNSNEILYTNRAMCHGALKSWNMCIKDSKQALQLNNKHAKAHFWLVKALIEMQLIRDARQYLLIAYNNCGSASESNAQFKHLEEEVSHLYGAPLRPRPGDFEILDELGNGNFSKIFKGKLKSNGVVYAIKTIEVMTVDRMKRRHRNIHNEILMEKRALSRLDHPNIVTLYATFKDYGTLYYQMEFLPEGELWSKLQEKDDSGENDGTFGLSNAVGTHMSIIRFVIAEALNALEYMHNRGIVHRDIKPENMLFTASGHVKFVDFGTAKDLINTDLNGPEFVGTPEYMSPATVGSKTVGPEGDLWAMGVVLYQMITGYTPFAAPSPYLGFLRTKRCLLRLPTFISDNEAELLTMLLTKDPKLRLAKCCSSNTTANFAEQSEVADTNAQTRNGPINYDALRQLPFFSQNKYHLVNPDESAREDIVQTLRSMHDRSAVRVPKLSELCRRAVGRACNTAARIIAEHGGIRPDITVYPNLAWVCKFSLAEYRSDADWHAKLGSRYSISQSDRQYIIHYLTRRQQINNPGLYRLFWKTIVDTKCIRSDPTTLEYLGYNRNTQGMWKGSGVNVGGDKSGPAGKDRGPTGVIDDFVFAHIGSASFGLGDNSGVPVLEADAAALKKIVTPINRLRPKFIVFSGNFTERCFAEGDETYNSQLQAFRKAAARVSDSIPMMFVPGDKEMGLSAYSTQTSGSPTKAAIESYQANFGLDFYGFWYNGIRCLVVNSGLFFCDSNSASGDESYCFVAAHAARQNAWLAEEIDMAKLCSTQLLIFTSHSWFTESVEEDDATTAARVIPKSIRLKWLSKLQHARVSLVLSEGSGPLNAKKKIYCFPNAAAEFQRRREARKAAKKQSRADSRSRDIYEANSEHAIANDAVDVDISERNSKRRDDKKTPSKNEAADWVSHADEEPLLPSQIIENARRRGDILTPKLRENDVLPEKNDATDDDSDRNYVCSDGLVRPPAPPGASDTDAGDTHASLEESEEENDEDDHDDDDDNESNAASDSDDGINDGESKFKNVDRSLCGPEVVRSDKCIHKESGNATGGIRLVRVYEHSLSHGFFSIEDIPADIANMKL